MGLLEDIAGQVLGAGNQGGQGDLVNAVIGLLGNKSTGGLGGLVEQFASKGLGDIINSWVSTGKNLPISPDQIQKGLGANLINQIATKSGLNADEVSTHLSKVLPQVVDRLTPDGKIPQGDIMSQGMNVLKSLLG